MHTLNYFKLLSDLSGRKILLPFYHAVSNKKLYHISGLYTIRSVGLFKKDIDFYCKYYTPVSISELFEIVSNNRELKKPVFHLSFDDGLKEIYTHVAPILKERSVPASVFINTDFIDNRNLFYRYKVSLIIEQLKAMEDSLLRKKISSLLPSDFTDKTSLIKYLLQLSFKDLNLIDTIGGALNIDFSEYLRNQQPYLSTEEIFTLKQNGFTLGSHSLNHPLFRLLDFEEQKKQLSQSFTRLEELFNIQDKYFSFPFSDEGVEKAFFDWMYNDENVRLSFGISGLKKDYSKYHLHRIAMEGSRVPAEMLVMKHYFYFFIKALLNKNTIKRR